MATTTHRRNVRASTVWYILAAVFATISVISALGEWVFHWWDSPGDVTSLLSFLLTLVAIGLGASHGDVERLEGRTDRGFGDVGGRMDRGFGDLGGRMDRGFGDLGGRMEEQTALLRELVGFFRARRP